MSDNTLQPTPETVSSLDERQKIESVSERCFRTHFQDCANCDDLTCGDNTSPHVKQLENCRRTLTQQD